MQIKSTNPEVMFDNENRLGELGQLFTVDLAEQTGRFLGCTSMGYSSILLSI